MAYNNKQYQAIADALKEMRESVSALYQDGTVLQAEALATVDAAIEKTCRGLQSTHRGPYSFKPDRFLKACGLT